MFAMNFAQNRKLVFEIYCYNNWSYTNRQTDTHIHNRVH